MKTATIPGDEMDIDDGNDKNSDDENKGNGLPLKLQLRFYEPLFSTL